MNLQLYPGTNFLQTTLWFTLLRDKLLLISNLHLMIYLYLSNKDLELSPTKSNWILFSNRKRSFKKDSTFKIFINNHLVERNVNIRFLDVILDCRLKGEDHFKQIIKKEKSLINVLSLAAVWWDSHLQLLLTIYRAVFRGSITMAIRFLFFRIRNRFSYS